MMVLLDEDLNEKYPVVINSSRPNQDNIHKNSFFNLGITEELASSSWNVVSNLQKIPHRYLRTEVSFESLRVGQDGKRFWTRSGIIIYILCELPYI